MNGLKLAFQILPIVRELIGTYVFLALTRWPSYEILTRRTARQH